MNKMIDEDLLLRIIECDSTIDVSSLAISLETTEELVLEALKQLESRGVIRGYHTLINWDKTNTQRVQAIIQVRCSPEREFGYDRIAKRIYRYDEVDTMYLLSGSGAEFIVNMSGKTMQEIAHFVGSKLAPIEGVTGTATLFVLKEYKRDGVIFEDDDDSDGERLIVTP